MRVYVIAGTVVAALGVACPAGASGGLSCEAKDAHVAFDVDSAVTRGMGGPFFNFHASVDIAVEGIPDDLRRLNLDEALVHSWLDRDEVKLEFYVERQDGEFASVFFVVETTAVDEGEYRGAYELTVFAPESPAASEQGEFSARGTVACLVD